MCGRAYTTGKFYQTIPISKLLLIYEESLPLTVSSLETVVKLTTLKTLADGNKLQTNNLYDKYLEHS